MSVRCLLCSQNFKLVTNTHLEKHNISYLNYLKLFPEVSFVSNATRKKRSISMTGKKLSLETRLKISKAHKGKILSEGHKKKVSAYFKGRKLSQEVITRRKEYYKIHGHPSKGKKLSLEARRNIGLAGKGRVPWNKGKAWSPEIKERISQKLIGIKLSEETRKKMSISQTGRVMSLVAREKISKAKKGKKMSVQHKLNMMKAIQRSPNKFEEQCIALFRGYNLPLKYVGDFNNPSYFVAGKVPDFIATNGKNVIVEVYSDYFKIKDYGSVENYQTQRKTLFSQHGWETIFVSYDEIKLDSLLCLEKLRVALK